MKVTKIVTKATMYDVDRDGSYTRMYIGRLTRRKVENDSGGFCISVEHVKAEKKKKKENVEKEATIEVINTNAAKVAENY